MYKLLISSRARKDIKKLSKKYLSPVVEALQEIKENPLLGKPLTRELSGKFSYRVGVYRIIYKVNSKDKFVFVLTVGHRSTVYN